MALAVAGGELDQAKAVSGQVQAHGFGVDRDAVAELDVVRKVVLMKNEGQRLRGPYACLDDRTTDRSDGAQERTRTSTGLPPQAPEACASTNSATWA